ncbi:MAG: SMC-Scp complex subunit ScpB [Akkermansiaceae bacterium]|jgi:segregation and condensation protein B
MDLPSILESLLVASESPLPSSELARLVRARAAEFSEDSITENPENAPAPNSPERALDLEALAEIDEDGVKFALGELNEIYEKSGRSFVVAERSKGWKIHTRADFAGFVKLLFPGRKPERLSPPAMETLAIIAYRQPVTKSALEAVRGVSCDGMLQKLLDRELVKISGRADLPGRPLLYATTELFLEHFGITDIEELPNIGELRKVELPDGTEEDGEDEKKDETAATADAETQLALSAVEKPAQEVAEPSEESAEEPESDDSDSSEEE